MNSPYYNMNRSKRRDWSSGLYRGSRPIQRKQHLQLNLREAGEITGKAREQESEGKVEVMPDVTKVKVKITQSGPTHCGPHGLYNLWNSPGQNNVVHRLFLLQGIFPTQGLNPGLLHCRWILYQLSTREDQEYWSGQSIPSPEDLPNPGIEA